MIAVNLVPVARLRAGQRKRRVRGWSALSAVVGLVLGGGAAAMRVAASAGTPDLGPSLRSAEQRMHDAATASEGIRRDLAAVRARLNANETAGKHPDWSVVLGLLARERGDKVVLTACELAPALPPEKGTKPERTAATNWTHTLVIEGFAESTLEAQRYCLRLERLGVFDAVTPPEATAGEHEGRHATRFRFECRFAERTQGENR